MQILSMYFNIEESKNELEFIQEREKKDFGIKKKEEETVLEGAFSREDLKALFIERKKK